MKTKDQLDTKRNDHQLKDNHNNLLPVLCRVFVNHMLSGVQQRNLERAWGRPVVDRVGLIIDIFAQRARTREAQLQVQFTSCHCL